MIRTSVMQEEGNSGKAEVKAGMKVRPGFSREAAKTLYSIGVPHASGCELYFHYFHQTAPSRGRKHDNKWSQFKVNVK